MIDPTQDPNIASLFAELDRRLDELERVALSPRVSIDPDGTIKVLDSAGTARVSISPTGVVETFDAGGVSTGTLP